MRLDDRVKIGSKVTVARQFEAEVVSVADDRLSCEVRPIQEAASEEEDGSDEATEQKSIRVPWGEIKLKEHL